MSSLSLYVCTVCNLPVTYLLEVCKQEMEYQLAGKVGAQIVVGAPIVIVVISSCITHQYIPGALGIGSHLMLLLTQ